MRIVTHHLSMRAFVALLTLATLLALAVPVPARADKGFDVTCGDVAYVFGSGTGLPSAKKDMEQARGRWGTAPDDNSGGDKTNSGSSFLPVSWTITVVDAVTGDALLADHPLFASKGHRNQDTIQCTFTSELAAAPPRFPNPGIATHTIIVVPRASP